ncbi:VOC family protein [Bathymodiolus thermophilus thioautotrophic gill symbiont]|uniref:Lactoylglutathione lyase (EC) n=1 Tax=Bathymodiolus thermophilus thioautotrophic gill symbiont TaxID=2360 RepID=A0A8H9CEV8_9GAMM|nr:VOC family protein [Bathymodiolus thermophilus thioautotrophic gill symbiont]CAB5495132.1 Lactoylglutathione lyase (EC [Bathymodiolus thermophilus thioautotrophic gill symbiont]
MVNFGYTINYVDEVDKALSFFEKAFDIKRRFLTDEKDYGELDTGATVLAFASHKLGQSNFSGGYVSATDSKKPLGTEIVLVTNEVQLIHENAIKNGAVELKAPEEKPWGQTVSYIRCPSGILIELCTPITQ